MSDLTTVLATIVAMVVLDWRLTVASLVLLPVFVGISRKVGAERRRIATERQRKLAALSSMVQESLSVSGILLGRTMGRAPALTDRFAVSLRRARGPAGPLEHGRAAGGSRPSRSSCPRCPP